VPVYGARQDYDEFRADYAAKKLFLNMRTLKTTARAVALPANGGCIFLSIYDCGAALPRASNFCSTDLQSSMSCRDVRENVAVLKERREAERMRPHIRSDDAHRIAFGFHRLTTCTLQHA
jgi:hypothetical protein